MAASEAVTALVDQVIDLFNRKSMDLPDGFFNRQTQFLLNGVPFEETLGRSSSDPLVLMLSRGPAGYRFTAKAVHHAIPDAELQRGELEETTADGAHVVTGECWLSGHLRGTGEVADLLIGIEIILRGLVVERVNASLDPKGLARLHEARRRP